MSALPIHDADRNTDRPLHRRVNRYGVLHLEYGVSDRFVLDARTAALRAAAELTASGRGTNYDVLALAEQYEAWLLRPVSGERPTPGVDLGK